MTSVRIKPVMSVATASVVALGISAASPMVAASVMEFQNSPLRYRAEHTTSSNDNLKLSIPARSVVSFEKEISNFYNSLAENQEYIGSDIENLIARNIASLYED